MSTEHLTAEQLQGLLDGRASTKEARRLRAHVAACELCSDELSALAGVFDALSGLAALAPTAGFADRVLSVALPATESASDLLDSGHVTQESLLEYLDGGLSPAGHGAVERHLAACVSCRDDERAWSALFAELGSLDRLAPSADFRERVLARVPVPAGALAASRRRGFAWAGRGLAHGAAAFVRGQVARVRDLGRGRWAVVAGVATAPAAVAASIAWVVLSHPLVTMRGLAQFAWLQATQVVGAVGAPLLGGVLESAATYQLWAIAQSLASTPGVALLGALTVCAVLSTSVWVLYRYLGPIYRNLLPVRLTSGRYARANV